MSEYHNKFLEALSQRHHYKIDQRLRAADDIWNDGGDAVDDCKRDAGVNHLKKKIWTLYSLLINQLHREGEEAIYLEAVEPDLDILADEIAEEIMDDLVTAIQEGVEEITFQSFIALFEQLYRRNLRLLLQRASRELNTLEDELQDSMFSGSNLAELKRLLLDFSMYPNCFALAAYKTEETENKFYKGSIVAKLKESYSFRRINPWNVFPCESRSSIEGCNDYFIIEDYCKNALEGLKGKKGTNSKNLSNALDKAHDYGMGWYQNNCRDFPALSMKDIPVVKYIGTMENGEYGEVWMIGGEEIYKSQGKADAAIVISSSYRPSNDSIWGTGIVDIGWRLQKVLDELSRMMVQNIGHRAKPGGTVPVSLFKELLKHSDKTTGQPTISYETVTPIPDEMWARGYSLRQYDVPDRTQQIQITMDVIKREIDSLLGIPGFADGSQNVGTVGRSYQGMFLLQSNMMLSIRSVWTHFSENILIPIAQRVINGKLLLKDGLETPTLDFSVRVRPFYMQDEDLEDADALIKRIQAIVALRDAGLVPPQAEQPLAEEALDKLGVDLNNLPNAEIDQLEQPQVPQQVEAPVSNVFE